MLNEQQARDAIIVAMDCDRETALDLADKLSGKAVWVKVGMTLFYRSGPAIVDDMRARGLRVFLDLKLHDIPNTVKSAMRVLSRLDVDMVNLHAAGTIDMMRAAQTAMNATYLAFEPLIIVACMYYVLVMLLAMFAKRLERRLRKSDRN